MAFSWLGEGKYPMTERADGLTQRILTERMIMILNKTQFFDRAYS